MLTVQILTKNNESTVARTLESLKGLEANVVVGDLGSTDSTENICREMGADVVKIRWENDYSKARNGLIGPEMNMHLEPWETILTGHNMLGSLSESHSVYVLSGNIVSKEVRVWKNARFTNPVYESIDSKAECLPEIVIRSEGGPDRRKDNSLMCEKWMNSNPTSPEPYYYMAMSKLAERNYNDFLMFSRQYLAMNRKFSESDLMLQYYMSRVELHVGDRRESLNLLLKCLSVRPEIAEFWCLLGDFLYKSNQYDRAKCMYENAITIGKRRKNDDLLPIEIDKYRDYPVRMMENIEKIKSNTEFVGSKK